MLYIIISLWHQLFTFFGVHFDQIGFIVVAVFFWKGRFAAYSRRINFPRFSRHATGEAGDLAQEVRRSRWTQQGYTVDSFFFCNLHWQQLDSWAASCVCVQWPAAWNEYVHVCVCMYLQYEHCRWCLQWPPAMCIKELHCNRRGCLEFTAVKSHKSSTALLP